MAAAMEEQAVTLSDFELLEVVAEDGRSLGRVFDLRAHGRPTTRSRQESARIDDIVYGTLGLLERLGIRSAKSHVLPWKQVVAVEAKRLVVRLGSTPGKPGR